jgi:hypothetical protein
MPIDAKHAPYARETAICVDLAYDAMEAELQLEIERSSAETRAALTRLLFRLRDRRSALTEFAQFAAYTR